MVATAVYFHFHGLPLRRFFSSHAGNALRLNGVFAIGMPSTYYVEQVNLLLLLCPAVLMLMPLFVWHRHDLDDEDRFLAIGAASMLVFQAIWKAQLGVYNDWNLYAIGGVVVSLLVWRADFVCGAHSPTAHGGLCSGSDMRAEHVRLDRGEPCLWPVKGCRDARRAFVALGLLVALGSLAVLAPSPAYETDRDIYRQIGRDVILPDCSSLHCTRMLIAPVLERLPMPSLTAWKAYAVVANTIGALGVAALCVWLGFGPVLAALASALVAFGRGAQLTVFDPYTSDPFIYALTPWMTLMLLEGRFAVPASWARSACSRRSSQPARCGFSRPSAC